MAATNSNQTNNRNGRKRRFNEMAMEHDEKEDSDMEDIDLRDDHHNKRRKMELIQDNPIHCSICHDIPPYDAVLIQCAKGHIICKDHTEHREWQKKCPSCKVKMTEDINISIPLKNIVDNIKEQCPMEQCGQLMKRKDIANHLKSDCDFSIVECEFKWMGCNFKGMRSMLGNHQCIDIRAAFQEYHNMQAEYKKIMGQRPEHPFSEILEFNGKDGSMVFFEYYRNDTFQSTLWFGRTGILESIEMWFGVILHNNRVLINKFKENESIIVEMAGEMAAVKYKINCADGSDYVKIPISGAMWKSFRSNDDWEKRRLIIHRQHQYVRR